MKQIEDAARLLRDTKRSVWGAALGSGFRDALLSAAAEFKQRAVVLSPPSILQAAQALASKYEGGSEIRILSIWKEERASRESGRLTLNADFIHFEIANADRRIMKMMELALRDNPDATIAIRLVTADATEAYLPVLESSGFTFYTMDYSGVRRVALRDAGSSHSAPREELASP